MTCAADKKSVPAVSFLTHIMCHLLTERHSCYEMAALGFAFILVLYLDLAEPNLLDSQCALVCTQSAFACFCKS